MVLKKSQRAFSFVLSLVMLLALSAVFCFDRAYAAADGEWTFDTDANGAVITGYIGTSKAVTVPSKVGGQRVYKVNAIATNNFKTSITSITFSNGISEISDSVCKGYIALERVSLPDTLTTIGRDAFYGCSSLTGITIPTQVSTIGENAFSECSSLISANLTCRATVIPAKLFANDLALTTLNIPAYTTDIGELAFSGCSSLGGLTLPETIKTIGNGAFSGCVSLKNIALSGELKTIGEQAFQNCISLTSIFIPNKVKTIGNEAFFNCTSLKEVYISPSVSTIQTEIFKSCNGLEKIVFGGEFFNFGILTISATGATLYYPEKYSSSWSNYTSMKMKSYVAATSLNITGGKDIAPGDKISLKITASPSGSEFGDIFKITSSNPTVATVSGDGTVIARATGVTTITVTNVNGISKSVDIAVKPSSPKNVDVSAKSTTSAVISWKGGTNVTGYNVYRSTTKNGTYKKVGSSSTTSYTDKGLTKGKTYFYKVASYSNSNGKQVISEYSAPVSITACAPAPATVSAKKAKSGVAKITWAKSTGCTGYEVYFASSAKGKFSKATAINKASTVSYTKSGLKSGRTYYFKVRSYTTVNGKKIYSDYTKTVKVKV